MAGSSSQEALDPNEEPGGWTAEDEFSLIRSKGHLAEPHLPG